MSQARVTKEWRFVQTYYFLASLPMLPSLVCQHTPHLLSNLHILLCNVLHLLRVPMTAASLYDQTFVPLAAGICRLVGEVLLLDLGPAQALNTCSGENLVVSGGPNTCLRMCRSPRSLRHRLDLRLLLALILKMLLLLILWDRQRHAGSMGAMALGGGYPVLGHHLRNWLGRHRADDVRTLSLR